MNMQSMADHLKASSFPAGPTQKEQVASGDINMLAKEFQWRRHLNLVMDDKHWLGRAKCVAEKANSAGASRTQINHLGQMAANMTTWSGVINYLNRQMSKTDYQSRRNVEWMKDLKKDLNDLIAEAESITESIAFSQSGLALNLKHQEAILILFRGFLERFAGFFLFKESQRESHGQHGRQNDASSSRKSNGGYRGKH